MLGWTGSCGMEVHHSLMCLGYLKRESDKSHGVGYLSCLLSKSCSAPRQEWDKEARDAPVQVRGLKTFSSWADGSGGRLKTFCPQSLKSKLDLMGAQLLIPT